MGIKSLLIPFAVFPSIILVSTNSALALTLNFTGGTAEFSDFATGGALLIQEILNSSGETQTEVHFLISYLGDDGQPVPDLNRTYKQFFKPGLANGQSYSVNPGFGGTFIYKNSDILSKGYTPDRDKVTLTGHFTPVPGPLPILGIGAAFTISRKMRKRLKGE